MQKYMLLIEDNPSDEALALRAFKKSSITSDVIVLRDGAQALEYLLGTGQSDQELPYVVFLDLKLPKVDGLEVLRRVRAERRTRLLPIVILTSSNEERDRLAAYENGANSYICKPVESAEFSHAVGQLGLYWLDLNQTAPGRVCKSSV